MYSYVHKYKWKWLIVSHVIHHIVLYNNNISPKKDEKKKIIQFRWGDIEIKRHKPDEMTFRKEKKICIYGCNKTHVYSHPKTCTNYYQLLSAYTQNVVCYRKLNIKFLSYSRCAISQQFIRWLQSDNPKGMAIKMKIKPQTSSRPIKLKNRKRNADHFRANGENNKNSFLKCHRFACGEYSL